MLEEDAEDVYGGACPANIENGLLFFSNSRKRIQFQVCRRVLGMEDKLGLETIGFDLLEEHEFRSDSKSPNLVRQQ